MTEKFFKITNLNENHNNYQYTTGLNILDKKFDKEGTCVPGGLYFTDVKNIFKFIDYGIYLREIILPTEDPDFQMVKDPGGDKWRANKIILGEKRILFDVSTFDYLISLGANFEIYKEELIERAIKRGHSETVKFLFQYEKFPNDSLISGKDKFEITIKINEDLKLAASHGYLDIVKFLIDKGADYSTGDNYAINLASQNGHLEVVKFLIGKGANCTAWDNYAVIEAAEKGHLEIVKLLIENGADYSAQDNFAIAVASQKGHLEVVKFLIGKGAKCTTRNNYAVRFAAENGHLEIVKLLIENGADVTAEDNYAIQAAFCKGRTEIVKLLIENGADVSAKDNFAIQAASHTGNMEITDCYWFTD